MLSPKEQAYIDGIARRISSMRAFLVERPVPAPEDASGWYRYLASLKEIQGNAKNDVSFVATLMAKMYLLTHFDIRSFDAAEKAQGAPGLDIEVLLADGRRLIAEIKTTIPFKTNDLGAQQKATFYKDFKKLATSKADVKFFFLTERRTFDLMRTAKYRSKLVGVTVILLPEGDKVVA
jgi:hypothetical protein